MTALLLDDVSHTFGTRVALAHLTLGVRPGRVTALIGLNGAGKTTALRALAGRLRPAHGVARVLGHDPAGLPADVAARFGQVVDTPLVHQELTVTENLVCAARLHGEPGRAAAPRASAAVGRMGLEPWRHARARSLSMGNRQRLGIACATLHRPTALILDEPTSALDPQGVVIVRELVRELADDGAAVLVSSHHLDEVARIADEIVVLHAGRDVGRLEPGGTDLEQRFFAMVLDADTRAVTDAGSRS
ncbi:ABC-2 type transport system ATP-binding protein [Promicromonospora umidemergens]|uniref:ABC transporter domain-containing protein n=1 Tax=Promicromonospora umidemergens TaxID=629679 RepID=A0ABP8WXT3_9MICO|nr:ABC transporter ATP-binding protein [Promicromonospora umidemergens]MCP2283627.1 ABC-2 type transport system ATP-binding protein [Promicromonospora umidemergens]